MLLHTASGPGGGWKGMIPPAGPGWAPVRLASVQLPSAAVVSQRTSREPVRNSEGLHGATTSGAAMTIGAALASTPTVHAGARPTRSGRREVYVLARSAKDTGCREGSRARPEDLFLGLRAGRRLAPTRELDPSPLSSLGRSAGGTNSAFVSVVSSKKTSAFSSSRVDETRTPCARQNLGPGLV